MLAAFEELYTNYKGAILSSGLPGATEDYVARVMAAVCERVLVQFKQPFIFPSFHQRILEPYDYYAFGQRWIRGLVDFSKSMLGHQDLFEQVQRQLAAGENVVLLGNHQSEVRAVGGRGGAGLLLCAGWRWAWGGQLVVASKLPQLSQGSRQRTPPPPRPPIPPRPSPPRRPTLRPGRCCWRPPSPPWPLTSSTWPGTVWSPTRCPPPSPWAATFSACTPRSTWMTSRS